MEWMRDMKYFNERVHGEEDRRVKGKESQAERHPEQARWKCSVVNGEEGEDE